MDHSELSHGYPLYEANEFIRICIIEWNRFDIYLSFKKDEPLFTLVMLFECCQPSNGLFFSPMCALNHICWKFFHSIFDLLICSLNIENWVRKYRLIYLVLLVKKDCFTLSIRFENSIDYVAFVEAICHVYSSFYNTANIFIRKADNNFWWIKILHSFSFLFLLCLLIDLSLLLNLNSFQLL